MSSVTLPVTRPIGRALIVASPSARTQSLKTLRQLGYECAEADDPYAAFVELCNHRLAYQTLILNLGSLYREELAIITTVKQRLPHIDIWLTQIDGRAAALADAVSLGADGLLAEDGLHRIAPHNTPPLGTPAPGTSALGTTALGTTALGTTALGTTALGTTAATPNTVSTTTVATGSVRPASVEPESEDDLPIGEPVLTTDELRALLQDQPLTPPFNVAD